MPGMDGETTLQTLKGQVFRAPVVVVTALSDPQVAETALQPGETESLLKTGALDRLTQLLS